MIKIQVQCELLPQRNQLEKYSGMQQMLSNGLHIENTYGYEHPDASANRHNITFVHKCTHNNNHSNINYFKYL